MERLRRALRGIDRPDRPGLPIGEALHPVTFALVAVLIVNDWVLKPRFAGIVTGKLSDVVGLAAAPVLLTAAIDLVLFALAKLGVRVAWRLTHGKLVGAIAATGVVFAVVKLVPAAAAILAAIIGHGARFVHDPTDLLALPALAIAYWIGRDELRRL